MEVTAPAFIAEGPDLIRRIEADELKAEVRFRPLLGKRVETDSVELGRLHVEIGGARALRQEGPGIGIGIKIQGGREDVPCLEIA